VALFAILLIVGAVLWYVGAENSRALTRFGEVNINAIVAGPPPGSGAIIYQPTDGTELTDELSIEVSGTCEVDSLVVITNNGVNVGSTDCSDAGIFYIEVQLWAGENILRARNYDNLNQPGPETDPVAVFVTITPPPVEPPDPGDGGGGEVEKPPVKPSPVEPPRPVVPENPTIIPGVEEDFGDCRDYKAGSVASGGNVHITIACQPRIIMSQSSHYFGFVVWGGKGPYAINVDYGDGRESKLISLSGVGYNTLLMSYQNAGSYKLTLRVTDIDGKTATIHSAIRVSGASSVDLGLPLSQTINFGWFLAPVPLYLLAIALTLGFWGGDWFDRKFGAGKKRHVRRRSA
jgi:hypothetical protein